MVNAIVRKPVDGDPGGAAPGSAHPPTRRLHPRLGSLQKRAARRPRPPGRSRAALPTQKEKEARWDLTIPPRTPPTRTLAPQAGAGLGARFASARVRKRAIL